jgi:tetratricopeptide (TPR) repeat protein
LYSWQQPRWAEAQQQLEQACILWASMGDAHNLMRGNLNLGGLYLRMEQPDEAISYLAKALDTAQSVGEEITIGRMYCNLGMAYRLKQNFGVAETYFKQAESIFQRASNLTELARTWNDWGLSYLQQQQWAEAKVLLEKSLAAWVQLGNAVEQIEVLLDITEGELAQGHYQAAAARLNQAERRLRYTPQAARHHHFQPRFEKYRRMLAQG